MKKLEHQLRRLSVRPSLFFRFKLSLKLWQKSLSAEKKPFLKIGFGFAIIFLLISSVSIYNYRQSYAYYLNLAKRDTITLEKLLNGQLENTGFLIKKALAANSPDEEFIAELSQKIVISTQVALEKIDDIGDVEKIKAALKEVEDLHQKEIQVFAKAVEKVSRDEIAAKITQAIEVTNQDIREVKKVVSQVSGIKSQSWLPADVNIDLKPTTLGSAPFSPQVQTYDKNSPWDVKIPTSETIVKTIQVQEIVEQKLVNFIVAKQKLPTTPQAKSLNEPASTVSKEPAAVIEDVSDHYLKAREYIDAGQYNKAYGLMTAAEAQTQFIPQPENVTQSVSESKQKQKKSEPGEVNQNIPAVPEKKSTLSEEKNTPAEPANPDQSPLPPAQTEDNPALDRPSLSGPIKSSEIVPENVPTPAIDAVKEILEKEGKLAPAPDNGENSNQSGNTSAEKTPPSLPEAKNQENNPPFVNLPVIDFSKLPSSETSQNKLPPVNTPKTDRDSPSTTQEPSIPAEDQNKSPTPVQPSGLKDQSKTTVTEPEKPKETPGTFLPKSTQFIAPSGKTTPKK